MDDVEILELLFRCPMVLLGQRGQKPRDATTLLAVVTDLSSAARCPWMLRAEASLALCGTRD